MAKGLYLIGTHHADHKGPERLKKILHQIRPSIICLEQTPRGATETWNSYLDRLRTWQTTPWHRLYNNEQIERARIEILSIGYEMWVPKEYKNGSEQIRLFCIEKELDPKLDETCKKKEMDFFNKELSEGKKREDLLTAIDIDIKDFIERGSKEEHQKAVDKQYEEDNINKFIEIYGIDLFQSIILERDQHFAARIHKFLISHAFL